MIQYLHLLAENTVFRRVGCWSLWALLCLSAGGLKAQGDTCTWHRAVVWRGFKHDWSYNHRINRIGDYVYLEDGSLPVGVHTSATGTGADSTEFTSYYTWISSPDVYFQEGESIVRVIGKERRLVTEVVEVKVSAAHYLRDKTQYAVVLNGFDMEAIEAADKIQLLRLHLDDPEYASATDEIIFRLHISLVVNCKSLECNKFNNYSLYQFRVRYLLMGFDDDKAAFSADMFTRSYPWSRRLDPPRLPERKQVKGVPGNQYSEATVGIKSFSIVMNEGHWLVSVHQHVAPVAYNATSGTMQIDINQAVREWMTGMKRYSANPSQSRFSGRRAGWVVLDISVMLIQFKQARIEYGSYRGGMYWRGHNERPNSPAAVHQHPLRTKTATE